MSAVKDQIAAAVERLGDELESLSHRIHDHPELGYQEVKAAGWLTEFLTGQGFKVERGEKSISIDSLYRVSVALSVPLYLLTDVGKSRNSVPSRDAERVLALVVDGPRPDIRRAYAILQTMFESDQPVRSAGRKTAARGRPPKLSA